MRRVLQCVTLLAAGYAAWPAGGPGGVFGGGPDRVRDGLARAYRESPPAAWLAGGVVAGVLYWPRRRGWLLADRVVSGYALSVALGVLAASAVTPDPFQAVVRLLAAAAEAHPWAAFPLGAAGGRLVHGPGPRDQV